MNKIDKPEGDILIVVRCGGKPECQEGLGLKLPLEFEALRVAASMEKFAIVGGNHNGRHLIRLLCWACFRELHPDMVEEYETQLLGASKRLQ